MLSTDSLSTAAPRARFSSMPAGRCSFVDIRGSMNGAPVNCALSVYRHSATGTAAGGRKIFHPGELDYACGNISQRRSREYLAGRYAAKYAVGQLLNEPDLSSIEVARGVFNQPVVKHSSGCGAEVSISHKPSIAVALAFEAGYCMGIDIEERDHRAIRAMESQLSDAEKLAIGTLRLNYRTASGQLWCIKEALSKILKTGLTAPFEIYETLEPSCADGVLTACHFKNFYQYTAKTWAFDTYILAIVHPRAAELHLNAEQFRSCTENRI